MKIDIMDLNIGNLNFNRSYDKTRNKRATTIYNMERVEIREVDKKDENNISIFARVRGGYETYDVTLNIANHIINNYNCTCPDYANGNICKHILATAMETIQPQNPSTPEGRRKMLDRQRKEREEALKKWIKEQEEREKREEYRRKYSSALNAIKEYKSDGQSLIEYEGTDTIDVRKIYEQTQIKNFFSDTSSSELAINIEIEPRIEIVGNNEIELSLKIGQTTKYVIKDIQDFCNAFDSLQILQYGKKLRFIAKKENFAQEDQKLLNYILDYGEILKYNNQLLENYSRSHYYYHAPSISGKTITIYEGKIDELFDAIKEKEIMVTRYYETKTYRFTDDKINIHIDLEKDGQEYVLKSSIRNYNYINSNKKIYIFYKSKIYTIDKEENAELLRILNLFKNHDEILIPKDKIKEFSTYVFPKIEKYLNLGTSIEETSKDVAIVNKLETKMYLDLDENDDITMELKFCYNDDEFNVLDKNVDSFIKENKIERNYIEERKILTKIFTDGFEIVRGRNYFVLKNLDATYEFLSYKVEEYMNSYEILVTEKFKRKEIKKPKLSSVSVKLDNGLLELDISKLDFDIEEIKNVLKNYNVKKKYYKLKNGDFLSLEQNEDLDFLNDMTNSFDLNYDKINAGVIKLPVNRSIYLDQLLNKNKSINTNKNDEFNDLVNNIENKNFAEKIKINKDFENRLRDYQKTGYKWLKVLENYKFGGILADDMGLGKTLQIIALLASNLKDKKTSIVVSPSSLVLNWKAEIEKWCPKIKVGIIKGNANSRKELINNYNEYDLIVTSYDLLKRDILEYEGKYFKYIIADEAQYIKNFTTQNATALKNLEGETKFALTGTPIENSVSELWSIFDFIMPGYLYTYSKFKKKFEEPILKQEDKEALKRLKTLINPFILRRIKKEVLTELPEKNITIMNNEMTDEQQKVYLSYFMQTKKEVTEELNENGFEKSKLKILMLLTRLRQICCHPSMFIENYKGESGKLNQCMDLVRDAIDAGHKILLFSSYTSMFEIIEERLKRRNIKYYKLTGQTQVSKRVDMVERFNKDDDIKVFLISLKAGGTGLNLTGADVVIHYDPWWNLSAENQATDRAYRIGQKNSVQVYKLITANSIEEKINKLQEKKAKLSEQLLSTEETFINKLSKEEIMELFS